MLVNADIRMRCGGVEIRDKTAAGTNAPTSAEGVTRPRHRRRQKIIGNANRLQASASGELLTYNIRGLSKVLTSIGHDSYSRCPFEEHPFTCK